jgi:hypothetical protein
MPVELPPPASDKERPPSPNMIVWLAIFIAFMLIGIAVTLLTWPKNHSTGTLLFWLRLLAFPAVAWGIVFGLRLHFHDEEHNRRDAEDEMRQADREEAILFGSEPLAVLGSAYRCAMGTEGVAARILQNESVLAIRQSRSGTATTRHTSLDIQSDAGHDPKNYAERMRAIFFLLLDDLAAALQALPSKIPFDVRLQLPAESPADIGRESMLGIWRTCWSERNGRLTETTLLSVDEGLMCLDAWLDFSGGPALEKITLIVAVQLHEKPPENSAEAAVAILLGWAPLAERNDLSVEAMLHRPVAAGPAALNDAFLLSLLWGRTDTSAVKHVWQTGLLPDEKPALLKTLPDSASDPTSSDRPIRQHDLDIALGYPGTAASWLAVALATENALQSNTPQLIAVRESGLRLAVIQPAGQRHRQETNEMDEQA